MSTPPTALKEIIGISAPRPAPTPVFTGDQRARILALISTALRDGRQAAVLGALQKDPSLCLENIPDPSSRSGGDIPFALACMKEGVTAGVLAAIANGFDIDTPERTDPRYGALLFCAVTQGSAQDVLMLLAMGADVQAKTLPRDIMASLPSGPGFDSLLQIAIGRWLGDSNNKSGTKAPKVVHALMDAGLGPEVGEYAVNSLIRNGDWKDEVYRSHVTQICGRLIKCGLHIDTDWNRPTHPMAGALGTSNGFAVEMLVALGCVGQSSADLFDRMTKNKLQEHIPAVQALLMKQTISSAKAEIAGEAGTDAGHKATVNRRRSAAI